jgi:N-acetylmuramoyl-L-alanine amidase CwlA
MEIIQMLIPATNKKTRPGIPMTPKYITIHETDNTAPGADALAHAKLQYNGNDRQASWHLTVDCHSCYQSIPFNEVAWHAGDGNGPGNMTSIALEICVNADGDYHKAVANAAEVVRQLMAQFHIDAAHVVQHNHWSGKNCPSVMRSGKAGITWDDFLKMLQPCAPDNAVQGIGTVTATVDALHVRKEPDINSPIVGMIHKQDGAYKSYGIKNNWYDVGLGWVCGKYVTFTPKK